MTATQTIETTDADILAAWTVKTTEVAVDNGWTLKHAQAVMLSYLRDTDPAAAATIADALTRLTPKGPDLAAGSEIATPHLKAALDARRAHLATCDRCTEGTACAVGFELDELLTFEGSLIQDAQERGHSEGVERVEAARRGDTIEAWCRVYTDGVLTGRHQMTLIVDRRWMTGPDAATIVSGGKRVDAVVASSVRIINRTRTYV